MREYARQDRQTVPVKRQHPDRRQPSVQPQQIQRAIDDPSPTTLTPAVVQTLQRTHGNRFVQRLFDRAGERPSPPADESFVAFNDRIQSLTVQTKLTVTSAGDRYEREADAVAKEVMRTMRLSRQVEEEEEEQEEEAIQAQRESGVLGRIRRRVAVMLQGDPAGGTTVDPAVETSIRQARGRGQALPGHVRGSMEQAFGADFGDVRIHAGTQADSLNRAVHAQAFTTGRDIFFRQGAYQPHSANGQHLLAHELTHVVQQGGGEAEVGTMDDAIQRKVGFEFEDSKWRAWKKEGKKVRAAKRKERLHQGTNFNLEGDDTPGEGLANIEFVTEPFEASQKGKADFSTTMKEIKRIVNRIEGNAGKPGPGSDAAVKSGTADMSYIEKNYVTSRKHGLSEADTLLSGGPQSAVSKGGNFKMQATSGVTLSDIATMMETFGKPEGEAAADTTRKQKARAYQANQKLIGRSPGVAREAVRLLSSDRTHLTPPQRNAFVNNVDDLVGFLSIVIMYIKGLSHVVSASGGAPAPAKYRLPFLGRNDLAQLFAKLPGQQKQVLGANNAVALINNVLAANNMSPLGGTDTGLTAATPLVAGVPTLSGLTIGKWLRTITEGTDLLKQNSDALFDFLEEQTEPGGMPKYMRREVGEAMEQVESFGTAPAMDTSAIGKALALFENRGIQPAVGDMSTDTAFQIGLNYLQFFIDLAAGKVDDNYQYPWDKPT